MSRFNSRENKAKRKEARANKSIHPVDREAMWIDVKDKYGRVVKKQVMVPAGRVR